MNSRPGFAGGDVQGDPNYDDAGTPVVLQGSGARQITQPAGAIYVGQYTFTSASGRLTGGPVGAVPGAVRAAAMALAPRGVGETTVGQYLLQVASYTYNQADYTTVINVYALPDAPAGPIVTAPAVGVQPSSAVSTTFHRGSGIGAPPMQPSWRPHNGTVPRGLGAEPRLHKGQWLARHNGLVYMHPRAGLGAVAANDALATAITGLLAALSTSAAANGGTALCSDVTAATTVFQSAYNGSGLGTVAATNTYDADTVAALNTAIAAYNPSGQASIQSFTSGSAPAACTNTASGSSSSSSSSPAPTPAATATVTTSSNTPLYVAGAAVLALGAYYAWKKKII